jgi:hypothetical protein
VNNVRGNLAFGEVVSGVNWSHENGSKRGRNSSGILVFEPRDDHKGVVARSMMYFTLRYNDPGTFFGSQETVLKKWNRQFPVTTKEHNRNLAVEEIQNKKNPFIVHPYFAERIYSFSTNVNRPSVSQLIYPTLISFTETGAIQIPLFNKGNTNINFSNVYSNSSGVVVVNYPDTINSGYVSTVYLNILANPSFSTAIILSTNIGNFTINLANNIVGDIDETDDVVPALNVSIYPNPVRDNLFVKSSEARSKVFVYNIRGQRILSELIKDDVIEIRLPENLKSGVYFVKVQKDNVFITRKFMYLK